MRSPALGIALSIILVAGTASAAGIAVLDAPDGGPCVDLEAPKPYVFSLYVVANTANLPLGGVVGGEFSLQGLEDLFGVPPDGVLVWTSEPNTAATVVLGDPFGSGTNIAFPNCQTGNVLLFTLHMIAYDHTGLRELHVAAHQQPSNPLFDCPVVELCDAPVFTRQCVAPSVTYFDVPKVAPPATNPFPEDGATSVPRDVTLRWNIPQTSEEVCAIGVLPQNVFLGTSADPPSVSWVDDRYYSPPFLDANTTYYWRIEAGPNTSPVWSFTTADVVAAHRATWTAVRALYR